MRVFPGRSDFPGEGGGGGGGGGGWARRRGASLLFMEDGDVKGLERLWNAKGWGDGGSKTVWEFAGFRNWGFRKRGLQAQKIKQGCEFLQPLRKPCGIRCPTKIRSANFTVALLNFVALAKFPSEYWTSLLQNFSTTLHKHRKIHKTCRKMNLRIN